MKEFRVSEAVGGWIVSYGCNGKYIQEVFTDQDELNRRLPELVAEMECE